MTTPKPTTKTSMRPQLEIFRSEGNRTLFIRLAEEETNDDSLVSLHRLLESNNISVERAMEKWKNIRAMSLPAYVERKLRQYYNLVELTEREWLSGGL